MAYFPLSATWGKPPRSSGTGAFVESRADQVGVAAELVDAVVFVAVVLGEPCFAGTRVPIEVLKGDGALQGRCRRLTLRSA